MTADVSSKGPQSEPTAPASSYAQAVHAAEAAAGACRSAEPKPAVCAHSKAACDGINVAVAARSEATVRIPPQQQHTSHSTASGGSLTSDEATVTLNNNPRMATPALTGKRCRTLARPAVTIL